MPSVAQAKSRVALAEKQFKKTGGDPSAVREARKALAEEKIKAYVEATVAAAPELDPDQLSRLASLFRGSAQ